MKTDSIHIKYLMVNERDTEWGITVNSVGFQHIEPKESYPPQNHPSCYLFDTNKGRILDEYQLVYIVQGRGKFYSRSSNKQTVSEGKMFLLFPGEWHSYYPDKTTGWDEYWIGFSNSYMISRITSNFFSKDRPVLNVGIQDHLVNIYLQAIEIAKEQKSGFQQLLAGTVEYLLGCAYSYNKSYSFEDTIVTKHIDKAKLIIIRNIYNRISPKEIARELDVTYSWFRKTFKEYTGFSPAQYANKVKIQKSKELLTNTNLSNIEISDKLGFDNPNYFCTLFKNKVKLTPKEYRNITQGKNVIV